MGMPIPSEYVALPPDVELFLTSWLRAALKRRGVDVEVDNKEPADLSFPLTRPLIVVRNDGGPKTSDVTFEWTVGITVLGGTRQDTKPTMDLARLTFALCSSVSVCLAEGSPLAAVAQKNGPYLVNDSADTARAYMTFDYDLTGDVLAI